MPIGPRPEPPPVPRKEPRVWQPEHYVTPLAYQSSQTQKGGLYEHSPAAAEIPGSPGLLWEGNSRSPSSATRLKGPRPLSSPPRPPKTKIPYPEDSRPLPLLVNTNKTVSSLSVKSADVSMPSTTRVVPMPEPAMDNDFDIATPILGSTQFPDVPQSPATSYSSGSAGSYSLVPPPLTERPQYSRNTRSIFQWGIPAELLPPMPVPVDAMSGLRVGQGGQYTMRLDLPEVPPMEPVRMKFSVEQLTVADFQTPHEVWSISSLARWLYELVMNYDMEILVVDAQQALTKLFLYRFNTLEWSYAERLAATVIASLKQQQFITDGLEQLVVRTSATEVSGVLTDLSGINGCYSPSIALPSDNMQCYSFTCLHEQTAKRRARSFTNIETDVAETLPTIGGSGTGMLRVGVLGDTRRTNTVISRISGTTTTLDVINDANPDDPSLLHRPSAAADSSLQAISVDDLDLLASPEMNWRKYWRLDESEMNSVDPTLVKLQFAIHELIMSELLYVRDLKIYLDVYGEIQLLDDLKIMSNQKEFTEKVFTRIGVILETNKQLLTRLLERQAQQGPYVQEIADLIREWAMEPDTLEAYTKYADDYLWTDSHLRRELMQNQRLQKWMEERAKDPRLTGRPHSFFFNRILPRVARYHLLLGAVLKYTEKVGPETECSIIEQAVQACNILTQSCDDAVAKQKRVLDVQNLKAHIVFKSSSVTADLKLNDKRRRLIRRGDMLRRGDLKMDWVDTHALLLDNFLVLSKTREGMKGTAFYVTKAPIPLDLLVLESYDEEGVVKVSSRITFTRHGNVEEPANPNDNERPSVMYPMRITHLGFGGQKYVLFVPTGPERTHWAHSIVEAKRARAQLAYTRSAEPFRLEKIADQFAYPESETPSLPVPIPDTPLHRSVGQIHPDSMSRIALRRKVNCIATVGSLYLVGTDYGLWIGTDCTIMSDGSKTKAEEISWTSVLPVAQKVIKIEILDTMNAIFVLDGDHNLIWYPLDQTVSRGLGDTRRTIGVRLNQSRKVVDFAVSYHRGRVVVMYLQQGGNFKVVEPIRSHGAVSMRGLLEVGLTPATACIDSFREVDRLQLSQDSWKVTPFLKSIVITTQKSFEWLTLESKQPIRIPSGVNSKELQNWGKPVRLIKLDNSRVLMCYEACYVICDITGHVGIQQTTWFLEKCVSCAYYAPYLIIMSQGGEMLEVRYVDEFPGRLVQLITGKDIKILSGGEEPVFIRIAHPWISGRQLILQMVGNETVRNFESTWYSSST